MPAIPLSATLAPLPETIRGGGILGWLPALRRDPLRFFLGAVQNRDAARFRLGHLYAHLFAEPAHIKHILVDNNHNYGKQTRGYDMLRLFLGDGLLTSEGSFWLRQRRIAQPAFHRQRIEAFAETMATLTAAMLERWDGHARSGQPLDVAQEMMKLTLRIVAKTLLNADVGRDADEIGDLVTHMNVFANRAVTNPLALPSILPSPTNLQFRRAVRRLDHIIHAIIAERRKDGGDRGDLLSMLIESRDAETGERMSDRQLRDEITTIFLAGHETTANALAWTFYLLSLHPAVERRLRDELDATLGGRAPTLNDLRALPYLDWVIKESMRLFPPAWGIDRGSIDEDVVGGYRVPAKTLCFIIPYVTHRLPHIWPNPEAFDPERFSPDNEASRPKFAYFPFGGGPRLCIGQSFAMMEAALVIATVLGRYRVDLAPGHEVSPQALITLRPRHGLMMHLQRVTPQT